MDFNYFIKIVIVAYVAVSILFVVVSFAYEIKYKFSFKGTQKFKDDLESKFRRKRVFLWLFAGFSALFFLSWSYLAALVLDLIFQINFLASRDNREIVTWFGIYNVEEFESWFLFILIGILGVKGLAILVDVLRILLDSSLVIKRNGILDYKNKL